MKDMGDYVLNTYVSAFAVGAVLSQVQDGEERYLAYGSRCISQVEKNYCVTYYQHYLLCKNGLVRSDHGCLCWLKHMKNPSGHFARWIKRLAPVNWVIQFRPGVKHQIVDSLSMMPCPGTCSQCLKLKNMFNVEALEDVLHTKGSYWIGIRLKGGSSASERHGKREQDQQIAESLEQKWDLGDLVLATFRNPILGKLLV